METNTFFNDLLTKYDLGHLVDDPILLPGGLLHESYKLTTSSGNYAVKLINPSVFKEEYALKAFEKESQMEDLLSNAGVCAVYPIAYDGSKMLEINGRYFYLADWFDGLPLSIDDVTETHCEKVAEQLARIHNIDFKETEKTYVPLEIDFDNYVKLCNEAGLPVSELLNDYLGMIKETLVRCNEAAKNVPCVQSLCHNDYDLKNVLWNNDQFRIIDLEAVAYNNPYKEIVSSALSWSGADDLCFDEKLFETYLNTYFASSRLDLKVNWIDIYDSNTRDLIWLQYNLDNALKDDISKEEKDAAILQINKTINRIVYFKNIRERVLSNDKMVNNLS